MKKLITLLLVLVLLSGISYAQFKYENPVWLKNNTGNALTNVQVLVTFNTQYPISQGWMQSNGNDIRFTTTCNGITFLPHFLEGYINTDSTKLWVSAPTLNPNDSILVFLYYGDPTANSVSTISVFDGPHSSTDSVVVTSTNTVSNCQRGFKFTANEDLLVAYFGKRIPNATQRYLTLFDFLSQAIVAQIQVDAGTSGQYNYNLLPTPFWIKSGQEYIMTLFNGSGDMYYYGTSSQIGQHLTYGDMRYCNNCTQNTFPTTILTNRHYGTPDFLYYVKQNVNPAPTSRILSAADTVTPAPPSNFTATAGPGNALLKCKKNTEFDIYQYIFYRNTTNNPNTATLIGSVNHPDTTYLATSLTPGQTYYFWVKASDKYCITKISNFSTVASCVPLGVVSNSQNIPKEFKLYQNQPNPFNPSTGIKFDLPKNAYVTLKIYDVNGKEVDVLINDVYNAGSYTYIFDGSNLASGVYFYRINAGDYSKILKMVLIK